MGEKKSTLDDIPIGIWINSNIIAEAERTGILLDAKRKAGITFNFDPDKYHLINASYLVSLLYCMIVVPREIILRSSLPNLIKNINSFKILEQILIIKNTYSLDNDPFVNVILHLRNAIAHVRYDIVPSNIISGGQFIFWDQQKVNSPENFRASMSLEALENFLKILGPQLYDIMRKSSTLSSN
jgi:hypothetical protein